MTRKEPQGIDPAPTQVVYAWRDVSDEDTEEGQIRDARRPRRDKGLLSAVRLNTPTRPEVWAQISRVPSASEAGKPR